MYIIIIKGVSMFSLKRVMMALLLMWMLSALATCVLSGEDNTEASWRLVGTWINPAYEDPGGFSGKVVYREDGTWEVCDLISDTNAVATGTYIIEGDWTEKGIHWFAVRADSGNIIGYEINKLTNNGNTYESVFSSSSYPTEFDPTSPSYFYTIRFRQQ